jgi:hypothetical protein
MQAGVGSSLAAASIGAGLLTLTSAAGRPSELCRGFGDRLIESDLCRFDRSRRTTSNLAVPVSI